MPIPAPGSGNVPVNRFPDKCNVDMLPNDSKQLGMVPVTAFSKA